MTQAAAIKTINTNMKTTNRKDDFDYKNRIFKTNNMENNTKIAKYKKDFNKSKEKALVEEAYKSDLITHIKVLFEAYKYLPKIIMTIDHIIEKRASSVIPTASIFGGKSSTYGEMNKVIDLSQRKDKLLNLYVMVDKMLDGLSSIERKLAVLKFIQKSCVEDIAKEIGLTERTVFRQSIRILEKLAVFMLEKQWNSEFIKFQIGNEPWLSEIFKKKKQEEETNLIRAQKLLK